MPSKKYALEEGGAKRLEIAWGLFWRNISVRLDDETLGTFASQKELKEGRDFTLADGSVLHVQLDKTLWSAQLRVLRDGVPLPGSATDPAHRLKIAAGVAFFVAGLNIIVGMIAEFAQIAPLVEMGFGYASILFGFVFLVLGFFIRRRSVVALAIAVVLFALDGIVAFAFVVYQTGVPPMGGTLLRIFLLVLFFRGFGAIKELKQRDLIVNPLVSPPLPPRFH